MPASTYTMSRSASAVVVGAWLAFSAAAPAYANVITDWDEKAIAAVAPLAGVAPPYMPYVAYRMMGMVHAAMFDAVNSIERRHQPYLVQLPADATTSKEAAAAAAAATVLATVDAKTAAAMKAALADYLAAIPDGPAKWDGVKLGEAVATKVLEARANDGCDAPDDYRPRTTPGVYVPTAITRAAMWRNVKPFAMVNQSQFRPSPPISLKSKEWVTDFNEIKEYGGLNSAKRTAQQTETARFWLVAGPVAYHPFVRQLVSAKQMNGIESARFMTLAAIAINDALIAVFDAKYHYNFWRPITAIRNGDIDASPATERDATWQPIADTPMQIPMRALHPQRRRRRRRQGSSRNRGGSGDCYNKSNGPGRNPPLDEHGGVYRRGGKCPRLGWLPLPLLDPRGDGYGAQNRSIRCEERDAARFDKLTMSVASKSNVG